MVEEAVEGLSRIEVVPLLLHSQTGHLFGDCKCSYSATPVLRDLVANGIPIPTPTAAQTIRIVAAVAAQNPRDLFLGFAILSACP